MPASVTVAVLLYHSIGTVKASSLAPFTVDRALFEEHLSALSELDVGVIPFREVPDALRLGRRAVAISFDDGLVDVTTDAAPALHSRGMPATLFVPSGYIGDKANWLRGEEAKPPLMSWEALAHLDRAGFEIGSHGHRHLRAQSTDPESFEHDVRASKVELEQRLGRSIGSFAYPYGEATAAAQRAVRAAGFAQAGTVGRFPSRARDDRWAIPRLDVRAGTTTESLLAMINRDRSLVSRARNHLTQRHWPFGRAREDRRSVATET
jgi:peptidoglycan/xylan/chitin deacetylase (PgdA/CDA1 family)